MPTEPQEPIIHLIEGGSATTDSLLCLLEAIDFTVEKHGSCEEFLLSENISADHVLFVELDHSRPEIFSLLNQLFYMACRPGIVLIHRNSSSFEMTDVFWSGRIEMISQPFKIHEFRMALKKLNFQI